MNLSNEEIQIFLCSFGKNEKINENCLISHCHRNAFLSLRIADKVVSSG